MYPYGQPTRGPQRARDSFKNFQALSDEAREIAALRLAGKSYNELFEDILFARKAANDNDDAVGDEVVEILLSKDYMAMLQCWLDCGKDMILTKLTYLTT